MNERTITTRNPQEAGATRRSIVGGLLGSAAGLALVVSVAPAAAAQDLDCVTYEVEADYGPSFWTFGDYDAWMIEAGGEAFWFHAPAAGAVLTAPNGADIERVTKCTGPVAPVEPVDVELEEPTPEPTPEPELTQGPVVEDSPAEPAIQDTVSEEIPEPAVEEEPVEEATIDDETIEWSADEPKRAASPKKSAPAPETTGSSPEPLAEPEVTVTPDPTPATPASPVETRNADPIPLLEGLVDPTVPAAPILPFIVGDAEVLGLTELADTGPQHVAVAATVGAALCALGFAFIGLGRRGTRQS